MKFKGKPFLYIVHKNEKSGRPFNVGRFDENGIIDVPDKYVKLMRRRFKEADNIEIAEIVEAYACKKCGRVFEKKTDLMTHYRIDHPKGDVK